VVPKVGREMPSRSAEVLVEHDDWIDVGRGSAA
jgi:hypothetical protein